MWLWEGGEAFLRPRAHAFSMLYLNRVDVHVKKETLCPALCKEEKMPPMLPLKSLSD